MERTELLCYLEAAKRHAEQGDIHILKQKQLIVAVSSIGTETAQAERILQFFEEAQEDNLAIVERILDALDRLPVTR